MLRCTWLQRMCEVSICAAYKASPQQGIHTASCTLIACALLLHPVIGYTKVLVVFTQQSPTVSIATIAGR